MIKCPGTELSQIVRLVTEARAGEVGRHDRRVEQRYSYFRPLAVEFASGAGPRSVSAFSRDISLSGVGLLSGSPLELTRCTLRITDEQGEKVAAAAEVMWCRPCGEGWYLAGARFIS